MRKWLRNLRKAKKWRQTDVAEKLGVTAAQYAYIESGERQADLNLSTASQLADIFHISLKKIREYEEKRDDQIETGKRY